MEKGEFTVLLRNWSDGSKGVLDRITPAPQNHADATYYAAHQNAALGDRRSFTRQQSVEAVAGRVG